MKLERTELDRLTDDVLLLCLWHSGASDNGEIGDRIKLMKLAFVAAYDLYVRRVSALNLRFYRWDHGPMANEVYEAWDDLKGPGLIYEDELFGITEEGRQFAAAFTSEVLSLPQNAAVRDSFHRAVAQFGSMGSDEIKAHVYDQKCFTSGSGSRKRSVRDARRGELFTDLIEPTVAASIFALPPGWQTTIELVLSGKALGDLRSGIEDVHAGRVLIGWKSLEAAL